MRRSPLPSAEQLEKHGVELRCGVTVAAIEADRVADVPCDLVVLAAGFKPNVELAAEAGVEIGRTGAIRTDERMETNLRGVFAAGDCAEVTHLVTGRPTYIPLGTTANKTGRVAGANAAGGRERFPGVVGTSIVGIFGTGFATTGFSVAQARAEGFSPVSARIEAQRAAALFRGREDHRRAGGRPRHRPSDRRVGDRRRRRRRPHQRDRHGAHSRMRVEDFEQLDLAYSPPFSTVWDPLLIAAQQLRKEICTVGVWLAGSAFSRRALAIKYMAAGLLSPPGGG